MNVETVGSGEFVPVDTVPPHIRMELAGIVDIHVQRPESTGSPTEYDAVNFDSLLGDLFDRVCDGEDSTIDEIQDFLELSSPTFQEPTTPEEELSRHVVSVEVAISKFIEENSPLTQLSTLNFSDIAKIIEIYNFPNLLTFAKDLIDRFGNLDMDKVDMVYRYRRVLYSLFDQMVYTYRNGATESTLQPRKRVVSDASDSDTRTGAGTWAGYFHRYGFEGDGEINTYEHRLFSEDPEDADAGHQSVTVDGVEVKRLRGVLYGERD